MAQLWYIITVLAWTAAFRCTVYAQTTTETVTGPTALPVNLTANVQGIGNIISNLNWLFGTTATTTTTEPTTATSTPTTTLTTESVTTTTTPETTTSTITTPTSTITSTTTTPTTESTTTTPTTESTTTTTPTTTTETTTTRTTTETVTTSTARTPSLCPGQSGAVEIAGTTIPATTTWIWKGDLKSFAYYGLKYGTANRFKAPLPNYNFSYYGQPNIPLTGFQCPQLGVKPNLVAEDCLYLDVYIPPGPLTDEKSPCQKFPVMLFLHGGQFKSGSKDMYPSANLSNILQAIIVIPNYRLGPLGFFSTGDEAISGNWGLHDVKLALAWTAGQIDNFGGDPKAITIIGHNSGAALASYLMLDPDNGASLVHGVLQMSGSSLAPWAFGKTPLNSAVDLAKMLGCPVDSTDAILECMLGLDVNTVLKASSNLTDTGKYFIPFLPAIDGILIKDEPAKVLKKRRWQLPGGYTNGFLAKDAGILLEPDLFWNQRRDNAFNMVDWFPKVRYPDSIHSLLRCKSPPTEVVKAIYNFYRLGESQSSGETKKKLIEIATDLFFAIPAIREVTLYSKNHLASNGTILYNISYSKFGSKKLPDVSRRALGAFHTLDLVFLFGQALATDLIVTSSQSYSDISMQMRNMVHNAIQYGYAANPGYSYSPETGNYLALEGPDGWLLRTKNHTNLLHFWDALGC